MENLCSFADKCVNTEGSYTCKPKTCNSGYKLDLNSGLCEDVNECLSKPCGHNSECINTHGSYRCECGYGFRKDPNHQRSCRDIDECLDHPGICDHKCHNTWGSYRCSCSRGYKQNHDNRTCSDINECEKSESLMCQGTCKNTAGSFRCGCSEGFTLENGRYCNGEKKFKAFQGSLSESKFSFMKKRSSRNFFLRFLNIYSGLFAAF